MTLSSQRTSQTLLSVHTLWLKTAQCLEQRQPPDALRSGDVIVIGSGQIFEFRAK